MIIKTHLSTSINVNQESETIGTPSPKLSNAPSEQIETLVFKGDKISLCTIQLRFLFDDLELATGTGFVYSRGTHQYLITNWHNVSGRNPASGECLSTTLGTPNRLKFRLKPTQIAMYWREIVIPLYLDTDAQKPRWIEHPIHGRNVDVVAIPLPADSSQWLKEHYVSSINEIDFQDQYHFRVTDDCYVIGFPFSEEPKPLFPIWKKASIASEPDIDYDNLPRILIDTATRSGLSGSPVIMRRVGVHGIRKDGSLAADTAIGEIQRFLGVYSNRIGKGEELAQLGVVWKARVIDEIISSISDEATKQ